MSCTALDLKDWHLDSMRSDFNQLMLERNVPSLLKAVFACPYEDLRRSIVQQRVAFLVISVSDLVSRFQATRNWPLKARVDAAFPFQSPQQGNMGTGGNDKPIDSGYDSLKEREDPILAKFD